VSACSPIPPTSLAMRTCWINGAFLPEDQASVSIFDRGLLFGDGVYEVAAVVNGRLLDADRHLVRLERSQREISLPAPYDSATWLDVMQALATQNGIDEGLVYLQVTRGAAERDFPFPSAPKPTAFAFTRPKSMREDPNAAGIRLHVVPDQRWLRCDIKSTAMLAQVIAKQAARAAGAFEAMMHEDGVVTEGGSSNLWIVRDGAVHTRPTSADILAGITRDVVLELAREAGIPVVERAFTVDQACAADECFMTSATSFVLPVTRIDERTVATGHAGPVTLQLREAYIARANRLTR
jgi:D-alanine transaminase